MKMQTVVVGGHARKIGKTSVMAGLIRGLMASMIGKTFLNSFWRLSRVFMVFELFYDEAVCASMAATGL